MTSAKDHCVRLHDIGLLESVFDSRVGSWVDYFEPVLLDKENSSSASQQLQRSAQSGQFGDVVIVKERKTGKTYALKIFKKALKKDEKQRLALLLKFSNLLPENAWPESLVRYISVFRFSEVPFETLLMNSIDGVSLKTLIDRKYARVTTHQWKCWMKDVLEALAFLHANGIMHRDVHPGNIMITDDGKRAILIDLDLMCVPSINEKCHNLCHGIAAAKSTAPDIWCFEDALKASTEPNQWYRSDVWATANAFLSYAYGEDGALTRRLGYTRRSPNTCKRISNEKVTREATSLAQFVDTTARPLVLTMLNANWKERPNAEEAAKMLQGCSDRSDFVAPGFYPPLKKSRTSVSRGTAYRSNYIPIDEATKETVYSEVGADDGSVAYSEITYLNDKGNVVKKTEGIDAYYSTD